MSIEVGKKYKTSPSRGDFRSSLSLNLELPVDLGYSDKRFYHYQDIEWVIDSFSFSYFALSSLRLHFVPLSMDIGPISALWLSHL
jgi:hypothetical protein